LVEEVADLLFVKLNLRRFNISPTPGIAHHGVQQVLLQLPLLRLC
jgi:hypothetical protein